MTTTYTDGFGGDINTACDVNLHSTAHTYNGGAHDGIQFGTYNFALIRFDLSALPENAIIQSATLYLGLYEGAGTASVYEVLDANSGWIEGTGNLELALDGEPCWDAKEADGAGGVKTAWAGGSNGCGVAGTDIASDAIGTLNGTGIGTFAVILDTATVQNHIGEYFEILIKPTTTNGNHIALSDYADTDYRPELVVEYYYTAEVVVTTITVTDWC